MSDRLRFIILACVIALLAGVFFILQSDNSGNGGLHPPAALTEGPAPDFSLPMLNGDVVSLGDYRGKVVFLNIWATWCPPWREEMPDMEKLSQKMKGEDFEILAVSIDANGAEVVAPFMKKNKLTFPALLDPKGITKGLYGITGVPETYIIDKQGNIVTRVVGPREWAGSKSVNLLKDLARGGTGSRN